MTENNEKRFRKYPSIENTYVTEFVDKAKAQGYEHAEYLITEKIHGANTQIKFNLADESFEIGKRTDYLGENEAFYNIHQCLEDLKENIKSLALYLKDEHEGLESVIVFGEVFGGSYPHKDVERVKGATKVQKGVFYSNCNAWAAFDIAYTLSGSDRVHYLPGEEFLTMCKLFNIPFVPVLSVEPSLSKALEYPNNGQSRVFEYFGLPAMEDNVMEGVVIRPCTIDAWMGQHRVIFKNKSEKYKEKTHTKRTNVQVDIPESVTKAQEEIAQYITESRVNNVISHMGEVTLEDMGEVIKSTALDVLEDFKKENGILNTLEKAEMRMVTSFMQKEVAILVRRVIISRL